MSTDPHPRATWAMGLEAQVSCQVGLLLLFIYFWFLWVFIATCGLSLVGASGVCSVAVHGLLVVVTSLVVAHRLWAGGLQWLPHVGSVIVAHRLRCSESCEIFPDQGLNLCPWNWQVDSNPLYHQENPCQVANTPLPM